MLALIAGTGDLPPALIARLAHKPIICAMQGHAPQMQPDIVFRLEHLGTLIKKLQGHGVTQICMAGAVQRPKIDPDAINEATKPLVPQIMAALQAGDDGALRVVISIFETAGFQVLAAHEIAPDLLPDAGVLTRLGPGEAEIADARVGETTIAAMGVGDIGQACIVRNGKVLAQEDASGTDAMMLRLATAGNERNSPATGMPVADAVARAIMQDARPAPGQPVNALGASLFKAPKPTQDRRADLPLIGIDTVRIAGAAGLGGIVIEAGGVMVLDLPAVIELLDVQGMFLWVRPKGAA